MFDIPPLSINFFESVIFRRSLRKLLRRSYSLFPLGCADTLILFILFFSFFFFAFLLSFRGIPVRSRKGCEEFLPMRLCPRRLLLLPLTSNLER